MPSSRKMFVVASARRNFYVTRLTSPNGHWTRDQMVPNGVYSEFEMSLLSGADRDRLPGDWVAVGKGETFICFGQRFLTAQAAERLGFAPFFVAA